VGFTHGYVLPPLPWLNRNNELFIWNKLKNTEILQKVALSNWDRSIDKYPIRWTWSPGFQAQRADPMSAQRNSRGI